LPFSIKKWLKLKEELWKFKYFTMQKYNLPKKILYQKETKILQDIVITLELISSFNTSPKLSCFQNPHIKIDLLLLLLPSMGKNPLSYYTL
jgi:hypothetical protein